MNSFKLFFRGLDRYGRAEFAARCGTTPGLLSKLIYGGARVELGLADAMVAMGAGRFSLDALPLTDRARFQHEVRSMRAGRPV
ncbi:hypothetical protein SAMN05444579_12165 [Delftia tsuruhatensis]|nr:hypothetical protein SAMN05444579_12165 [Delftia tsuruhatensis]